MKIWQISTWLSRFTDGYFLFSLKLLWIKRRRKTVDWQFTQKLGFVTHNINEMWDFQARNEAHLRTHKHDMRPFGNKMNILENFQGEKKKNDWLSPLKMKFKASTYWFIRIMIKWMSLFVFFSSNIAHMPNIRVLQVLNKVILLHIYFKVVGCLSQRWKCDIWCN